MLISIVGKLDKLGPHGTTVLPGVNVEDEEEDDDKPKRSGRLEVKHENLRELLRLPTEDICSLLKEMTEDHLIQRLYLSNLSSPSTSYMPVSLEAFEDAISREDKPLNMNTRVLTFFQSLAFIVFIFTG